MTVWADKMQASCLKVLDPALYFLRALLLIINIVKMGKKLRNREILTETDHEEEDQAEALPHLENITHSAIRKNLKKRLLLREAPKMPNINSNSFFILSLQKKMQQPLTRRDHHSQPLLMPHLSRTDGDSRCHDMRTCLLPPLSRLQHRI